MLNSSPGNWESFLLSRNKEGHILVSQYFVRKDAWLPVQIYKIFLVGVEDKSEFAGRRKRIESESRSGILDKRQEKAMEKTITKLCLMLAMLHLVRMADAVAIESKGRWKSWLRDKFSIFWRKLKLKLNRAWLPKLCKPFPFPPNYPSWISSIDN